MTIGITGCVLTGTIKEPRVEKGERGVNAPRSVCLVRVKTES